MTAERGLCGGFNSNIAKLARADAHRLIANGKTVKILTVGRKGADNLRRDLGKNIVERKDFQGVRQITFVHAEGVAKRVLEMFEAGEFDVATLYFSEFRSVISQKPTALQLIPATVSETSTDAAKGNDAVHEYEPSEEEVLGLPAVAEHLDADFPRTSRKLGFRSTARSMSAMDNATRNAGDMINKLTIKYNRQRQANITKELIEIISGAEAV